MNRWRPLLRILKNKYVYSTLAFLVWIIAFDRNNLIRQYELTQELNTLRQEKAYYIEEIRKDSIAMAELMSSLEQLEKFGRERYLMKKKNEEIFLVIPEDKDQ